MSTFLFYNELIDMENRMRITKFRKKLFLSIAFLIPLIACNFPLWTPINSQTEPPLQFRTQIPHNVSFPTPIPTINYQSHPPDLGNLDDQYTYKSLSGDTLQTVARHFGVELAQISYEGNYAPSKLLPPGIILLIPKSVTNFSYADILLPDSEVIYSPSVSSFDINRFVTQTGGYLAQYSGTVKGESLTGAQIVEKVAKNTSVNPMLLLAFIELRSHWVTQIPPTIYWVHPLDLGLENYEGLYLELAVAARYINTGYYAWRYGQMTDLIFTDGSTIRIAPTLNAGSVGIQYLMAQLYSKSEWETMLYSRDGLIATYYRLFGDPTPRAAQVEPLFTADIPLPSLELPFAQGETWALTGGLHEDWTSGTPWGALDFAPLTSEPACAVSKSWVLAVAPGLITRAENNQVILALEDGQGNPTGWEIFYMHIANEEMIPEGTKVNLNDRIGHPSCQGGSATGTHVHIARKFKGEWIGAIDPFPFTLSGWTALPGVEVFKSTLEKGQRHITADPNGAEISWITR